MPEFSLSPPPAKNRCPVESLGGTQCIRPAGHSDHHVIPIGDDGRSWMSFTDRALADMARVANERENVKLLDQEHHQ